MAVVGGMVGAGGLGAVTGGLRGKPMNMNVLGPEVGKHLAKMPRGAKKVSAKRPGLRQALPPRATPVRVMSPSRPAMQHSNAPSRPAQRFALGKYGSVKLGGRPGR